jgi:3-deoxy-manno-octulosonate cytidylyltransferase (CMP-KDO synthetase)
MQGTMSDPIILIPARLSATRLPNKPLADIDGEPMIVHVWRRAMEAGIGPVAVATDSEAIAEVVTRAGGLAVMTRSDHVSGSDRIFEAVEKLDPGGRHDVVVNVQGDLPTIDSVAIAKSILPLSDPAVDLATLVVPIRREAERTDPNVVKMIGSPLSETHFRALYFTRATAPYGEGPLYHHIGLYAYRRKALERFVSLPPSPLEMREKLEQLRALEAGMRIDAIVVDDVPLGVDTPHDLERARAIVAARRTP